MTIPGTSDYVQRYFIKEKNRTCLPECKTIGDVSVWREGVAGASGCWTPLLVAGQLL